MVPGGLDQNASGGDGEGSQVSPRMGQVHSHHMAFVWLFPLPGNSSPRTSPDSPHHLIHAFFQISSPPRGLL